MKTNPAFPPHGHAAPAPHDDTMPLGQAALEAGVSLEDMEIRAGLCVALAELSESMRALLGLMGRHNFITVLPDRSFPAYEQIMDRIGTAVAQAGQEVDRSRDLDRRITVACMPSSALFRQ